MCGAGVELAVVWLMVLMVQRVLLAHELQGSSMNFITSMVDKRVNKVDISMFR